MSTVKQDAKHAFLAGGVVALIIGLVLFFTGLYVIQQDKEFEAKAVSTMGTISNIEIKTRRVGNETKKMHVVEVEYFVDDTQYFADTYTWHRGMSIGDDIVVLYDPENPSIIQQESAGFLTYFPCGLGAMAALLGLALITAHIYTHTGKGKRNPLKFGGICKQGIVKEITEGKSYDGKICYRAECIIEDDANLSDMTFVSDLVPEDITALKGTKINIYIDLENRRNYYVDLFDK